MTKRAHSKRAHSKQADEVRHLSNGMMDSLETGLRIILDGILEAPVKSQARKSDPKWFEAALAACDDNDRRAKLILEISDTGVTVKWEFPFRSGGRRNVKWTNEKDLEFLSTYESAEKRVSAAVKRYSGKDPLPIRLAMVEAANKKLPAGERLPESIIGEIAKDPGQLATPSTSEIALKLAALEFGTDHNSYLLKVLTRARKLRSAKR